MLCVAIILTLYHTASAQRFLYTTDLNHVLYGNLTSLTRFLPSDEDFKFEDNLETINGTGSQSTSGPKATNGTKPAATNKKGSNATVISDFSDPFMYNISAHKDHHDILEYHTITQNLENITRRWYVGYNWKHDDPEDRYFYEIINIWASKEDDKKKLLSRINMQWLLHTRYFVSRALRQREEIRSDKRFQLGYLFNRLRRLSSEQLKVYSTAAAHAKYQQRSVEVLMRFYERMVHLDIDVRDTVDLIKKTYVRKADYDSVVVRPSNATKG